VIVVTTISAARARSAPAQQYQFVMTGLIDPVGQGLIVSLARLEEIQPVWRTGSGCDASGGNLRATFPTIRLLQYCSTPPTGKS